MRSPSKQHVKPRYPDYYPFGSMMPGRNSGSYAYGQNSQERNSALNKDIYSAEYWMYDARLGRRWEIDPLTGYYPWQSPYATFNNNPIKYSDFLGLEGEEENCEEIASDVMLDEVVVEAESDYKTPSSIPASPILNGPGRNEAVPLLTMDRKKELEKQFIFMGPIDNIYPNNDGSQTNPAVPQGTPTTNTPERYRTIDGERILVPWKVWQMEGPGAYGEKAYYYHIQQPHVSKGKRTTTNQVGNPTPLNANNVWFEHNMVAANVLGEMALADAQKNLSPGQSAQLNIIIETNVTGPNAENWVKSQLNGWVVTPSGTLKITTNNAGGGIPTATVYFQIIVDGAIIFDYGDNFE